MSLAGGYWESYYRRGGVPWDPGPFDRNLPKVLDRHRVARGVALDIGCGTGGTLVYLAERGFDCTGIDVSPTAIAEARRRGGAAGVSCRWIVADFPEEPSPDTLPPGTFDLIVERGFLHMFTYQAEQQAILRRLRQLLKPDGLFYGLFAKREGARNFGGPPKWSASEIEETLSPHFPSVELTPGVFTPGEPGSMPAWIVVAKPS